MARVSINDHQLHEVEMLLMPYSSNTASYLKYPEHRIEARIVGDQLLLWIPAFLALELYRRAILPQDPTQPVTIHLRGKNMGRFVIIDFRYPNTLAQNWETITITWQRVM